MINHLHSVGSLDAVQRRGGRLPSCAHAEREVGRGTPPPLFPLALPLVLRVPLRARLQDVQRLADHAAGAHLGTYRYGLTLKLIQNTVFYFIFSFLYCVG